MAEEKFASLSSGLLARKGAAKPAMRRQGYINPHGDVADDLGWNDMGFEPPQPMEFGEDALNDEDARNHAEPPTIRQQFSRLAEEVDAESDVEAEESELDLRDAGEVTPLPVVPRPRPPGAVKASAERKVLAREKAAFTLRLDPDRHLRLRLASAVSHCSAQQLVTEALDAFLAGMPELEGMAGRAPRRNTH